MSGYEGRVADWVRSGENTLYSSTPVYIGDNPIPVGVTLEAVGDNGSNFALSIINRR